VSAYGADVDDCSAGCYEKRAEGLVDGNDAEEVCFEPVFCYFHVYVKGMHKFADGDDCQSRQVID
jgi:hypothetical protein